MASFGLRRQEHHGGICHKNLVHGEQSQAVSIDGLDKDYGSKFSRDYKKMQTTMATWIGSCIRLTVLPFVPISMPLELEAARSKKPWDAVVEGFLQKSTWEPMGTANPWLFIYLLGNDMMPLNSHVCLKEATLSVRVKDDHGGGLTGWSPTKAISANIYVAIWNHMASGSLSPTEAISRISPALTLQRISNETGSNAVSIDSNNFAV
jgi:hypothetical protein